MIFVRLCEAERLCEQGDGHLIRQPAAATFPHWGRLLVNANNVTALNEISFVGEAFRLPFCKQAARTNKMAAHQISLIYCRDRASGQQVASLSLKANGENKTIRRRTDLPTHCRDRRPRLSVICYILMFSRVVEGADPYRGIEKPFISSPPRGYENNEADSEATCCTDALSLQGFR